MISEIKKTYYKAVDLATKIHDGQLDKGGHPYIKHILSVADKVYKLVESKEYANPEKERFAWVCGTVAILHDTLEDSKLTIDDLNALFDKEIVDEVIALTRCENESYGDYIKRISKSTIATYVKYCDLEDNLDVRRLSKISEQDIGRINKYLKWYRFLEKVINDRG